MKVVVQHRVSLLIISFVAVTSAAWAVFIPWTWSTIDDPGFVLLLQERLQSSNILGVVWGQTLAAAVAEPEWGVFRPAYWLYQSTVYLLPVDVVHGLRMSMFLVAIIGPLVFLHRKGRDTKQLVFAAVTLGIAAAPLSRGLFFLSLQELSGAAFIGLGLMARGPIFRTVLWTIAAWFKSPFSWLLIGYAVILWRKGERKLAVVNAAIGISTLGIAVFIAREGNYTSPRVRDGIWQILDAAYNNGLRVFETPTALLLLTVIWWVLWTKGSLRWRPMGIVLGFGWVGYTAQMTQWEVTSYYFGPILFLLGVFLVFTLRNKVQVVGPQLWLAFTLPLLVLIVQLGGAIQDGLKTNGTLISIENCILQLGPRDYELAGEMLNVVTPEGAIRIQENMMLRENSWTGRVTFPASQDSADQNPEYLILVGDSPAPAGFSSVPSCSSSTVKVLSGLE